MPTDEEEGRTERIVAFRRRRKPVLLPADPTDEELARDWTLSETDVTQVLRCRGDAHRLWFAIQLCTLRRSGRFVDPSQGAPGRIVSHLCGQIGLEPLLFLQPPNRQATLLEYEQLIRCHLGYQPFDEDAQQRLDAWLYDRAAEGVPTVELFDRAETVLGRWKIELPAPSTLERLVSTAAVRARQETFARLVAHGTNLGISTMGHSAEGVSIHQLQRASRWFLREETIKAANAAIVNFHHELSLSSMWGDGTTSSSDGQRFNVRASSLSASYYPRYFGYYDCAVSVVTHTSDQHSVFGTQVLSCAPREAQYVLDGLLQNNTVLRPREHYTDTHGYTEHIFGLCYLLGITFAPRLKDLTDQQIYKLDREASYPSLDPLFRGSADVGLILEQWDELVRVAASLRRRTAPPHVIPNGTYHFDRPLHGAN